MFYYYRNISFFIIIISSSAPCDLCGRAARRSPVKTYDPGTGGDEWNITRPVAARRPITTAAAEVVISAVQRSHLSNNVCTLPGDTAGDFRPILRHVHKVSDKMPRYRILVDETLVVNTGDIYFFFDFSLLVGGVGEENGGGLKLKKTKKKRNIGTLSLL